MIGFFNHIPNTIEINGPILSFTGSNSLQPISTSFCVGGSASLVGYATARFPIQSPTNPAENNGYIEYHWHEVGVGQLSDSANISGSATTCLTLYNLKSSKGAGRRFFLRADYVNSAYGIGKSTGNAINESLDSSVATLTLNPNIKITSQPSGESSSSGGSELIEFDSTIVYGGLNPSNNPINVQGNNIFLKDGSGNDTNATFSIVSSDSGVNARFSPDGRTILYDGAGNVTIKLQWDDNPGTAGVAVNTISVGGVTLTRINETGSDTKTFKITKTVVAAATPSAAPSSSTGNVSGTNITIQQSYTLNGIAYPVIGYLWIPTGLSSSSIDIIVTYHPTIENSTTTILESAAKALSIMRDDVGIKDKIIFAPAYPQDAISVEQNANLLTQAELNSFYLGDNLSYAKAALLWAKNNLNSFMSSKGVSKTIKNVYLFGHSQGGSLVHKLNTLVQTNAVCANAPGPIRLDQTCAAGEGNPSNKSCRKLYAKYGTATRIPLSSNYYFQISLENYVTGHLAPITYTQGLDDTTGYAPGVLGQVGWMTELTGLMEANNQQYSYYTVPTGGHDSFVKNPYLHTVIKDAFTSSQTESSSSTSNVSVSQGQTAKISVVANVTDGTNSSLIYQWYANGTLLKDGKNSSTVYPSTNPTQTVTIPGWNGTGIYLDLSEFVGSIDVNITTSQESSIFHSINIPGVAKIPENLRSRTYTLQGGKIYGPCTAPRGRLYIGNERVRGIGASGNKPNTSLVVEEGGDDWNDMVLRVNKGLFKRYSSAPEITATSKSSTATMTITDSSGNFEVINLSNVTSYSTFNPGEVYTITTNADVKVQAYLRGAKGGTSTYLRSVSGGTGGTASGILTFFAGQTYKVVRGSAANNSSAGSPGGGSGNGGGGGGGYSGIFKTSQTLSNAILIAGAGGGGANDPEEGGIGGGLSGGNGQAGNKGGTQSAGGLGDNHAGNRPGSNGSALQGGSGAAGGGGGYYGGGGGGGYPGCCDDWAGGGGSGYIDSTLVTSGTFTATSQNSTSSTNGIVAFDIISIGSVSSSPVTATVTVSGSTTPNLSITSDVVGTLTLSCLLSHPTACNSPLLSNTVDLQVVNANQIIKIEKIEQSRSSTAVLTKHDLYVQGEYTITGSGGDNPALFSFYASERDLDVFIDLYGGPGINYGSNIGGQGGFSRIRLTMKKNVEYVLAGMSPNGAVFLYRQSTLIAAVGSGGNAGAIGNGGSGGGVNVSGAKGGGQLGGSGGALVTIGGLTTNGSFGSSAAQPASSARSGDTVAAAPNGGRTLSCPKGDYWKGTSPCTIMGNIQFYIADGTLVTNTATISRGFKAGYGIRNTGGLGASKSGNGGAGATGGAGGSGGSGGGGGSGYSDGSFTIVSTQQGGNTGVSKVVIRTALS